MGKEAMKAKPVKKLKKVNEVKRFPGSQGRTQSHTRKKFVAARNPRGYGLKFKLETYNTVSHFAPGTKIKYGPNPKSVGSKSRVRYDRYMGAKTVGESLKCGSKLADLCWELERGMYKVIGGARTEAQEIAAIGKKDYDKAVKQLACFVGPRGLNVALDNPKAQAELQKEEAWQMRKLKKCEVLAPKLGLKPESIEDMEAMNIPECADIRIQRRVADALAAQRIAAADKAGKKVTDQDCLEVLELWGFAQNGGRFNVMPEGHKYVYSDTLGAIRRRTGSFGLTPPTRRYPNFPKLLCRWLQDHTGNLGGKFVCTAINVNANYAAKTHRDGNNEGPSIIKAFGDFKGGRLRYWPGDSKKPRPKVETLRGEDAVQLDIRKDYAVFDGNQAHNVEPFSAGDRYSIVFFTASGYKKVSAGNLKQLQTMGFPWPKPTSMATLRKHALKYMPKAPARKGGKLKSGK